MGHMVQGHCAMQDAPYIALVAWGVPPDAEDPFNRADRGRERASIPKSAPTLRRSSNVGSYRKRSPKADAVYAEILREVSSCSCGQSLARSPDEEPLPTELGDVTRNPLPVQ